MVEGDGFAQIRGTAKILEQAGETGLIMLGYRAQQPYSCSGVHCPVRRIPAVIAGLLCGSKLPY